MKSRIRFHKAVPQLTFTLPPFSVMTAGLTFSRDCPQEHQEQEDPEGDQQDGYEMGSVHRAASTCLTAPHEAGCMLVTGGVAIQSTSQITSDVENRNTEFPSISVR